MWQSFFRIDPNLTLTQLGFGEYLTLTLFPSPPFLIQLGFGECLALTLFPSLPFLIELGFGECLALTLFPSLPKTGNDIKTKASKTKMYSVCTVGPNFPLCKQQGFPWLAHFGIVNHLNLLCCVPTSCMCMPNVALHWKVGVKLCEVVAIGSMRSAPRLFGGFFGV